MGVVKQYFPHLTSAEVFNIIDSGEESPKSTSSKSNMSDARGSGDIASWMQSFLVGNLLSKFHHLSSFSSISSPSIAAIANVTATASIYMIYT